MDEITVLPGSRVGGYLLEEKIASGGSGSLWRARGDAFEERRALKLLSPFRSEVERQKFYREVFALSRLNHPNIARISDMGIWHHEGLRYPFVVMEFVEGETLTELANNRVSWRVWKGLLVDILQALSHAHAIGIVHRDIKPGNILVELDHRGERIAKLVDFGIARVLRSDALDHVNVTHKQSISSGTRVSGTPRYMAPEQIENKLGAIGPWTDLYALGCMVWRLVSLSGPFEGDIYRMLAAHLHSPLPEFSPVIGVPAQLEQWLRWLMEKNPYTRCSTARQALEILEVLGPVISSNKTVLTKRVSSPLHEETEKRMMRVSVKEIEKMALLERWIKSRERGKDVRPLLMNVPGHWDSDIVRVPKQLHQPLIHPLIWRYSAKPLIGRRHERDVLWSELRQVQQNSEARRVQLCGVAGVGKRHLQQWFCRHVKELDCADVVMIDGEVSERQDGVIRDALRQLAFLQGVHPRALPSVLKHWLEQGLGLDERSCALELEELSRLFAPEEKSAVPVPAPSSARVQIGGRLLSRILCQLARRGRLVLATRHLDHHPDLRRQLEVFFALAKQQQLEVLVVDIAPAVPRVTSGYVSSSFEVMDTTTQLELAALPAMLQQRAIASLLALDPVSAQVLVERTSHDLALAKMHLHKWVHQGIFANHETSLDLILPSEFLQRVARTHEEFWTMLFSELRTAHPEEGVWLAMEVSALMRQPVHHDIWRVCCERFSTDPRPLLERLIAMGFVRMLEDAWCWRHDRARHVLIQQAIAHDRLHAHHRVIAQALEACHRVHEPDRTLHRASEHWLQANAHTESLDTGLRAGELAITRRHFALVREIIAMFEHLTLLDHVHRELGALYKTYLAALLAQAEGEHDKALELTHIIKNFAKASSDPRTRQMASSLSER